MIFDKQYLYVFFSYGKPTFISKIISKFTRSKYTHVGLIFWNLNAVLESIPGQGVRYHSIFNFNKGSNIDIYRIKHNLNFLEIHDKSYTFINKVHFKPYDWPSILGIIFNNNIQDRQKYFCSELVFNAVYEIANIKMLNNIEAYRVIPRVLSYSPLLEYVKTISLEGDKNEIKEC